MVKTPEQQARETIDASLAAAGWVVQDARAANPYAAKGVALREFPLERGHGTADYILYIDGKAAGVVEAKKAGSTLTGVETQTGKYSTGLPARLPRAFDPLPFLYESTGFETRFTNLLDPEPRSRYVFSFHSPRELAEQLAAEPFNGRPASLRARLQAMPEIDSHGFWDVQRRAISVGGITRTPRSTSR